MAASSSSTRDPVEVLAAEFVDRLRRGEHPSIAEYAAKHPTLAAEINDLFPTIAKMEQCRLQQDPASNPVSALGMNKPEELGDFRIIREIGRGGMGIVYEAEQRSLGRKVAVKLLPQSSLLNPRQLQRFEREARTAARLHHTNIVPVFGVGSEGDHHFIVMQLISGVGLDAISPPARTGPAYWRKIARIGMQVADALGYAHERNVLHRDIKPANLILDQQGVVWVTDFGLAKAIEEDDSVSRTGDIVGTLRYMAPERLHGKGDATSDIYSLGLTLYEMLALQPAYKDSDASSLLRKIAQEPPPRLGTVASGIPRDLETIVMKTIAREPKHRYRSAEALAEDLRRFTEDRPIRARRISSLQRLWRWCGRNRAMAGLTATALALLVAIAIVASVGYVRTSIAKAGLNSALTELNEALAGESRQRQKAEATTHLALEALDDVFRQFAPGRMSERAELTLDDASDSEIQVPVQPVLSKEAAALLEHMLVFYDRLAAEGADDENLRRKAADANRRVGNIRARLGQFELAKAAYFRAIDGFRRIQKETATPGDISTEIARTYNDLGELQAAAGARGNGRSFHMEALKTLDDLVAASDAPTAARYETARACYLLGCGDPTNVASAEPRPRPDSRPDSRPHRRNPPPEPAPDPSRPGRDQISRENELYLLRAIGLLTKLVEEKPGIPDYQHLLACCYRDFPPMETPGTEGPRSPYGNQAIRILEELVEAFPAVPGYQYDLARTYLHLGPQLPPELPDTAEDKLRKALGITEKLVAEHPNVPDYAASEVQIRFALAETLRYDRRPSAAEPVLREALDLQSSLVSRFPDVVPYKIWKAMIQDALAKLVSNHGRPEEAISLLKDATAMLEEIVRSNPESPEVDRLLERSCNNLADVYGQLGQRNRAEETRARADKYRQGRRPPRRRKRDR